ncbi:MAG: hypothetical protein KatS3mg076_2373 [Candidatus Binatia bacterium]|nr:MAG: hypothetical protein KatS3mg076_2373 [Candidatus Binatia bacterium]
MIVDTSAIVAIFFREPDFESLLQSFAARFSSRPGGLRSRASQGEAP